MARANRNLQETESTLNKEREVGKEGEGTWEIGSVTSLGQRLPTAVELLCQPLEVALAMTSVPWGRGYEFTEFDRYVF